MAEIFRKKVSSLDDAESLDNLVVLGVDGANNSVKVPILLLKGNTGDDGADGTEIELQKTATHLQWRYVGGSWADLVALADLKGDKGDTGANIELQKSATHLQWRVSGTATWNDLVALADLKGAKGDTGEGFIIKGYYNTLSALQLAVPTPNAGDAYGVGNTAPFDIYVFDSVSSAWVNNGALQGPAGASSYTYIAYASNDQGADFSLTDGAYIAIKTTTEPIANPVAADFAGLWKQIRFAGTANRVAKSDGTKLVNSAIREVGGKVALGNDSPLANFDFVGTSVSRGDVYTYRDVVSKYLGAGIQTGAVVITLPRRDVGPMFQITIKGYNNTNATVSWEVTFAGYWLYTTNVWDVRKVEVKGSNPFGNQVRVGYSGSLPVLVLGDTNTQFNFASVSVTEVIVSYSNLTFWGSGWTITQLTDLTGYTLVTPTIHTYYHSGNLLNIGTTASSARTALGLGSMALETASNYLPLSGGTLTLEGVISKKAYVGTNWARDILRFENSTASIKAVLAGYGSSDSISYIYLGFNIYDGNNLRVYSDKVQFGNSIIYHSGNLDPALLNFLTSQSTVTTLASLPVTKRVIVATVTAATTLSLAATLEVGRELHIKVYNTSGSAITQPLPTSAPFESKKVDGTNISSISIPAGGSAEISILSVTDKYIIKTDA